MIAPATIHAGAVLIGEIGVLVRGASGSGKSSLILDLLEEMPEQARLVADDRTIVSAAHGRLLADVPPEIAGLIEMRGVGIRTVPFIAPVAIRLIVDLIPEAACPRMPEVSEAHAMIEGVSLPRFCLPAGRSGLAARVLVAARDIFRPSA